MVVQLGRTFDFLYNEVSPFLIVGLSTLYFVASEIPVVPYILVAGWLATCFIFTVRVFRVCWKRGWIKAAVKWLKYYLSKAWIQSILGLRYVLNNLPGRVLGLFAVINLFLFIPWIKHNIKIFKLVRATIQLIRDCVEYIRNPPELLRAFDIWKDSIPIFGRMLNFGQYYVDYVLEECGTGSHKVLIIIPIVTIILGGCAVFAYAVWNWRMAVNWGAGLFGNPQGPPPDDSDDESDDNNSPGTRSSKRITAKRS
jgi:hypothetical protein